MKPKPHPKAQQTDLFQARFEQLLDHEHRLFRLGPLRGGIRRLLLPRHRSSGESLRLLVGQRKGAA